MKDNKVSFFRALQLLAQTDFPTEFINEIKTWKMIIKSPYGLSFYNSVVNWNYKEHNTLRISDHWNFSSHNKLHCETTTKVSNTTHWSLGIYDETIKKWTILISVKKVRTLLKDTINYKFNMLNETFNVSNAGMPQ